MRDFSNYIVYVDESGDHGLANIDQQYPIFVLSFCIFKKLTYYQNVVPAFHALKFRHWGHDAVVLHEHDLRKNRHGYYAILSNREKNQAILNDLSAFMAGASFNIVASCIDKEKLKKQYATPSNPYELSLLFCMERLHKHLIDKGQNNKTIDIVFESRGTEEDKQLELEFYRICQNSSACARSSTDFSTIEYRIHFIHKVANQAGLQIADLTARPIGLSILRPQQENKAFEIINEKFTQKIQGRPSRQVLKVFP